MRGKTRKIALTVSDGAFQTDTGRMKAWKIHNDLLQVLTLPGKLQKNYLVIIKHVTSVMDQIANGGEYGQDHFKKRMNDRSEKELWIAAIVYSLHHLLGDNIDELEYSDSSFSINSVYSNAYRQIPISKFVGNLNCTFKLKGFGDCEVDVDMSINSLKTKLDIKSMRYDIKVPIDGQRANTLSASYSGPLCSRLQVCLADGQDHQIETVRDFGGSFEEQRDCFKAAILFARTYVKPMKDASVAVKEAFESFGKSALANTIKMDETSWNFRELGYNPSGRRFSLGNYNISFWEG